MEKIFEHDDNEFHRGVVVVQNETLNKERLELDFLASSRAPSRMRVAKLTYLTYARSSHPSNHLTRLREEIHALHAPLLGEDASIRCSRPSIL